MAHTQKPTNNKSRTENSLRNVRFGLLSQAAAILANFFARGVFVSVLNQGYLGLEGTFSSILSMLSLAELGVGTAITYSLYKPLAENNQREIIALMQLYRKVYWCIGAVVALLGVLLTPALPFIIKDIPDIPNIQLIYLIFVANSALSYFFVYKQSIIIADQKKYLESLYHYGLYTLMYLGQTAILVITRNYYCYLGIQLLTTIARNILLSRKANQLYPYIKQAKPEKLNAEVKSTIIRNTKAMVAHRIGGVVVLGTDNLLISFFVGAVSVGLYSNYRMVTNGLSTVYGVIFNSLTASVGNLGATEGKQRALEVFQRVDFAGRWLYGFSAVCLVILFNPFITLWLGSDYLFNQQLVCLVALNFYVTGMRQPVLTFRNAYGLYWYDRYKPLFESVINLVASIALAIPFGIAGILLGTFVSTMTTCFWVEPYVLYKYELEKPVKTYFISYGINTLITVIAGAVAWYACGLLPEGGILLFALKAVLCAVSANAVFLLAYHATDEMRYFVDLARRLLRKFFTRKHG